MLWHHTIHHYRERYASLGPLSRHNLPGQGFDWLFLQIVQIVTPAELDTVDFLTTVKIVQAALIAGGRNAGSLDLCQPYDMESHLLKQEHCLQSIDF